MKRRNEISEVQQKWRKNQQMKMSKIPTVWSDVLFCPKTRRTNVVKVTNPFIDWWRTRCAERGGCGARCAGGDVSVPAFLLLDVIARFIIFTIHYCNSWQSVMPEKDCFPENAGCGCDFLSRLVFISSLITKELLSIHQQPKKIWKEKWLEARDILYRTIKQ